MSISHDTAMLAYHVEEAGETLGAVAMVAGGVTMLSIHPGPAGVTVGVRGHRVTPLRQGDPLQPSAVAPRCLSGVKKLDGTLGERNSYGNDPDPPKA
jgi:hypothetical protein